MKRVVGEERTTCLLFLRRTKTTHSWEREGDGIEWMINIKGEKKNIIIKRQSNKK